MIARVFHVQQWQEAAKESVQIKDTGPLCTWRQCSYPFPGGLVGAGNTVICSLAFVLPGPAVIQAFGFFDFVPGCGDDLCGFGCHQMIFRSNIDGDTVFDVAAPHGNQHYTASNSPELHLSAGSQVLTLIYFACSTSTGSDIIESANLEACT